MAAFNSNELLHASDHGCAFPLSVFCDLISRDCYVEYSPSFTSRAGTPPAGRLPRRKRCIQVLEAEPT